MNKGNSSHPKRCGCVRIERAPPASKEADYSNGGEERCTHGSRVTGNVPRNTLLALANGGAHLMQLGGGALGFVRAGVEANHGAQFAHRGGFLPQFGEA